MMKTNFKIFLLILFSIALEVQGIREHFLSAEISNEDLENIPATFNKNIEALEINNCKINSLENLSTYKQLKQLVIKNSLIHIFNETFLEITKLRRLEHLSLVRSSIKVFDLRKLGPNVKYLDLSNNPGIEIRGTAAWSKVSSLNIANNNLSYIPDGLKFLRYLENVVLNGNPLLNNIDYFKIWPKLKNISFDKKVRVETLDSNTEEIGMKKNIPEIFAALAIIILITIIAIQFYKRSYTKLVNNSKESEPFQIISLK